MAHRRAIIIHGVNRDRCEIAGSVKTQRVSPNGGIITDWPTAVDFSPRVNSALRSEICHGVGFVTSAYFLYAAPEVASEPDWRRRAGRAGDKIL